MNLSSLIASAKKQPIGFGCGLFCLLCVVILYLRSEKVAESQAEFDAKAAEAARIVANVRNSANLSEQVVELQALAKEMESRLVRAGQLAVNLQYFYKLEAENRVKLVDIRQNNLPAGKAGKSAYAGIPYAVGVQGSYPHVLAFLHRLEAGRHFCRFNNVTLSKSPGSGTPDGMSLILSIDLLGTP